MKATSAGSILREEAQSCQWLSFYQRELAPVHVRAPGSADVGLLP